MLLWFSYIFSVIFFCTFYSIFLSLLSQFNSLTLAFVHFLFFLIHFIYANVPFTLINNALQFHRIRKLTSFSLFFLWISPLSNWHLHFTIDHRWRSDISFDWIVTHHSKCISNKYWIIVKFPFINQSAS